MTQVIKTPQGLIIVIAAEKPHTCAFCAKVAELRPYGPNGEHICFQCGQANIASTTRKMHEYLFGSSAVLEEKNP